MKIDKYIIGVISFCIASAIFSSCQKSAAVEDNTVLISTIEMPAPVSTPDTSIPEGWVIFPKPKENSKEARCGNYSRKEWKVEIENGRIKISPDDWKRAREAELGKLPAKVREIIESSKDIRNVGNGTAGYHVEPFEKGWLVGTDAGEWGGRLSWVNEDGSEIKELMNENIRGIARIDSEVLVLGGLAHLTMDEGKIWKLGTDEKGAIKAALLKDLGSQPQGFVVKDKDLLVALNNKFLRVSLSGDTKIFNETGFNSFYPNSMAIDQSGVVYVGARHFVVRFVPIGDSYREEWLAPQDCQKFSIDEKELECICRG
jgi:hypothetical protein